jgi:hypothetical protein
MITACYFTANGVFPREKSRTEWNITADFWTFSRENQVKVAAELPGFQSEATQ